MAARGNTWTTLAKESRALVWERREGDRTGRRAEVGFTLAPLSSCVNAIHYLKPSGKVEDLRLLSLPRLQDGLLDAELLLEQCTCHGSHKQAVVLALRLAL